MYLSVYVNVDMRTVTDLQVNIISWISANNCDTLSRV